MRGACAVQMAILLCLHGGVFGLGVWVLGMTGSQVHEKLDVTANIRQEIWEGCLTHICQSFSYLC